MKRMLAILVLCLTFGSAVLSAPNIVIYRYEGKDLRDVPDITAVDSLTIDPWVRDNAKWPAGQKIALLVHGFSMFSQGKCRNGLIGLAAHLSHDRKVDDAVVPSYGAIYIAEYPVDYNIIETATGLAIIVNDRCSLLPKETKIDVFAHSMGGLVARAAVEYPEVSLGTKTMVSRVAHLVTMGTPHHGFGLLESKIFKEVLDKLPVEISDMDSTGQFIKILNSTSAEKPKVPCDYYSIIGARSYRPEKYLSNKIGPFATIIKKLADKNIPVHDGLINANSAGYDLSEFCRAFKKTPLDLNHDYIKSHPEVFEVIDHWMVDDGWFGATSAKQDDKPASKLAQKPKDFLGGILSKIKLPKIPKINLPDILNPGSGKAKAKSGGSSRQNGPEKDIVTSGTGYLRLLGLDYNGVISRLGKQPDNTWENNGGVVSTVVLGWCYKNQPLHGYILSMHFDHYENLGSNETLKIIHTVNAICQDMKLAVPPRKIVSANVLDSKPQMILLNGQNSITIVWFMDGMTYALGLTDTDRKLIENRESVNSKGILTNKCFLTAAGKNFRSCNRTEFFVCVDREIEIFPPRGSMRYYDDNRGFISTDPTGVIVFKFD